MPAVAAHCLAYSKVVSAATVRTFRALLKTMRLNPRRESNPYFSAKKGLRIRTSRTPHQHAIRRNGHTRANRDFLSPSRQSMFHSIAIGIGGTPKAIGPRK